MLLTWRNPYAREYGSSCAHTAVKISCRQASPSRVPFERPHLHVVGEPHRLQGVPVRSHPHHCLRAMEHERQMVGDDFNLDALTSRWTTSTVVTQAASISAPMVPE